MIPLLDEYEATEIARKLKLHFKEPTPAFIILYMTKGEMTLINYMRNYKVITIVDIPSRDRARVENMRKQTGGREIVRVSIGRR